MAEKKEKRYVSDNAQLMAEWNWEKNNELGLFPDAITCGSGKKAWWICSERHEWQALIAHRSNGVNCPICSKKNRGIHHSKNWIEANGSLADHNPKLSMEWHPFKNGALTPNDVASNSSKKVWWQCLKGHEWEASISNRNKGRNCPYCSGRKVLIGYNDLSTVNPTLAHQWNYEKNKCLKPECFTANSHKMVWWKCSKGHEWQATIAGRNYGRACPICGIEHISSFPEYAILYYLEKYGLESKHLYRDYGYELDIYIPSLKIAIEYDGFLWQKNRIKNDLEKNQKCKKDGIKLYRIREELPSLNDFSIDYIVKKNQNNLSIILKAVLSEILGTYVDVDIKRDYIAIENLREYTEKENSILFSNSKITKEWNYEKNGNLKPENFTVGSRKKVWWKCSEGHEWQAVISDRNRGHGCPYCSSQKVLKGYNDLQTVNPTLAQEWNYEKNDRLMPSNVTPNSNKKVWWKCNEGHEWQATISNRNAGKGCPYCSGRFVVKEINDLQTLSPLLEKEWNYEKNKELTPMDVKPNSHKKVWWRCNQGHEWQAIISDRNRGHGCPYCSNQKVLKGYNDLQTVNPALAQEWNYEKNDGLLPTNVVVKSNKKVWWKCSKGHEWQAVISSRNSGRGCPYCSGKKIEKGYNDLQTINPILAKEWSYEKNGTLTPIDVTPNSGKKVWWRCNQGHEWQSTIANRNKGRGCPYCAGRKK